MGWTCTHKDKDISTEEFILKKCFDWTEHDKRTGATHTVIGSALVNQKEFYAALEIIEPDGMRRVCAVIILIEYHPKEEYNFCWKDMDESMGPHYYNCPERILELLTPTDQEYACQWREGCRENINHRHNAPQATF